MTIAIVDQPSPARLRPSPVRQRRSGPATVRGPMARPVRPAPLPPGGLAPFPGGSRGVVPPALNSAVRACRVNRSSQPATSWRLTDRGIALVLVLTAMIVLAALSVIGLTAWRVTSPGYQASGVSQVSQR